MARSVAALLLGAVVLLGVASATSLGAFEDVTLAASNEQDEVCTAPSVTFYGGTLGSLFELLSLQDLTTTEVTYIELTGLEGDCAGTRPVVVVLGEPLLAITDREVLSRTLLPEVTGTADVLLEVTDDVDDELDALLGTTATPDEVRVAFCPTGLTVCQP